VRQFVDRSFGFVMRLSAGIAAVGIVLDGLKW